MVRATITTLLGPLMLSSSLMVMPVVLSGAQTDYGASSGYHINQSSPNAATQDSVNQTPNSSAPTSSVNSGPVRLARFSYVDGNIVWRSQSGGDWTPATINMPIRQGAQIWVTDGGHAEIQFDDGSLLRLGSGALATLTTLYSDSQGEFTEITMQNGLATVVTRHKHSIYQIDTPIVSIKANNAAQIRVGVGNGVELSVQQGAAVVDGNQGESNLQTGDYLYLRNSDSPYNLSPAPPEDSWDRWNDQRNNQILNTDSNLPSNISLVAGNLNEYGSWRNVPQYGNVWVPRVDQSNWRPYHNGRWVWVDPFGWTWVSDEPWGWAPYHYGTWADTSYGWGWVPGPAEQYWSPAVVDFSVYDGEVAWAPLCPREVRYPSYLSVGFASGNWASYFSIGGAASYYYDSFGATQVFVPRPYNTTIINQTNITNNYYGAGGAPLTAYQRFTQSAEYYASTHQRSVSGRYVPVNARTAYGASVASRTAFGGVGNYRAADRSAARMFQNGDIAAAPRRGTPPLAGPVQMQPTSASFMPTRARAQIAPPRPLLGRNVFQAPLPSMVRKGMPLQIQRTQRNGYAPRQVAANARINQNRSRSYSVPLTNPSPRAAGGLSPVQRARVELGLQRGRTTYVPNSNDSRQLANRNRSGSAIQPRNPTYRSGGRQFTGGSLVPSQPQRSGGAAGAAERARLQLDTRSRGSQPINQPSHSYGGYRTTPQYSPRYSPRSAPSRPYAPQYTPRYNPPSAPSRPYTPQYTPRYNPPSAPSRPYTPQYSPRYSPPSAPSRPYAPQYTPRYNPPSPPRSAPSQPSSGGGGDPRNRPPGR